ncbi:hypothetical protein HDU93_002868, partial [Gonapodya sp. JEL0774]
MDTMVTTSSPGGDSGKGGRQPGGESRTSLLEEESKIDLSVLQAAGPRGSTAQDRKQRGFQRTVLAINEIVQKKLYKAKSNSLEGYFREHWKMSRAQVYRFLDSAYVLASLEGFEDLPSRERICRALKKLCKTPRELRLLWGRVLDRHKGGLVDQLNSTSVLTAFKELEASGEVEKVDGVSEVVVEADGDDPDADGNAGDRDGDLDFGPSDETEFAGSGNFASSASSASPPNILDGNRPSGVSESDHNYNSNISDDFDSLMAGFAEQMKGGQPDSTPTSATSSSAHLTTVSPTSNNIPSVFGHIQSAAAEAWEASAAAKRRLSMDPSEFNIGGPLSGSPKGIFAPSFGGTPFLGVSPHAVQAQTSSPPQQFPKYGSSSATSAPSTVSVPLNQGQTSTSSSVAKPKSAMKRKNSLNPMEFSATLAELETQTLLGVPFPSSRSEASSTGVQTSTRSKPMLQRPPPLPPTLQGATPMSPSTTSAGGTSGQQNVNTHFNSTGRSPGSGQQPPGMNPPWNAPSPVWRWTPPSSAYLSPDNHLIDALGLSDGTAADDHEVPSADFSMLTSLLHHLYARGYALFGKVGGEWRGDILEWKVAPWNGQTGRGEDGRRRGEVALTEAPK